jgi:1-acyl-sn-glycerol-3-phosphate acyltransferase
LAHSLPGAPVVRRARGARVTQVVSRLLLRVLNIRCALETESGEASFDRTPCLFLPNHVSYVDALLISAYVPAIFVTSREIEATPVLGQLTRATGCVFVERRHKGDVLRDVDQIAGLLNQGASVTLFPEGTTSPGDRLLAFKKTLLEAAVRSRCRVRPVAIEYLAVDGAPYDSSNRDAVAWYGDMRFFPHLIRLAATRSIDVRMTVMEAVPFRAHGSRKQLAADVRSRIARRLSVCS